MARRGWDKGISMIEVLVSMMILVIAVTGVFSVAISTTQSRTTFEPLEQTMRSAQSLNDVLKSYVSADYGTATMVYAPGGTWKLPGDRDTCAHAFDSACVHIATNYLPQSIKDKHPNATMTYRVTAGATPDLPSKVDIEVTLE